MNMAVHAFKTRCASACLQTLTRYCNSVLFSKQLNLAKICTASIVGKAKREQNPEYYARPKPWPYKERPVRWFHVMYDGTLARFNSNTKIITVEGPIGVGKTTFAKELALELDMMYMPEANINMEYIDEFGINITEINDELKKVLPWTALPTLEEWYQNPRDERMIKFQYKMFYIRFLQYCDALSHLLNTGQGVVMDRSVFSDHVYMDGMYSAGYCSYRAYDYYWELRADVIPELLKPHVCIYLDVPVDMVKERIKERGNEYEQNTEVLSDDYLKQMEKDYKEKFLVEMSKESDILIYDWKKFGDFEMVIEDLENLTLDDPDRLRRFRWWNRQENQFWADLRIKYDMINRVDLIAFFYRQPMDEIPELHNPDLTAQRTCAEIRDAFLMDKRYGGERGGFFATVKNPIKYYTDSKWGTMNNCLNY